MDITSHKKAGKSIVKFLIILSLNIPLGYFTSISILSRLYIIGRMIGMLYIMIHMKEIKFRPLGVLLCLYHISVFVSTYLYSGMHTSAIKETITPIIFILMLQCMLTENAKATVRALSLFLEGVIYINCVIQFVFPAGLYDFGSVKPSYLLGHQNQLGIYLLVALSLNVLRVELDGKIMDKRLICLFVVGLISAVKIWSVTSLMVYIVFLSVFFFCTARKKRIFNMLMFSAIFNMVLFCLIVLANNILWMSNFFTLVDRDVTFSGRRQIWDSALRVIADHPLLGVGLNQGMKLFGFTTAHNRYLNTLFTGGMAAFILFIAIIFTACMKSKQGKSKISIGLAAFVSAVLLAFQFESWINNVIYAVFIMIDNQENIFRSISTDSISDTAGNTYDTARSRKMIYKNNMNLDVIVQALWHRLWAIILAAVIGGGALFAYAAFWISPTYKSSIMIYVNNSSTEYGYDLTYSSSQIAAAQSLADTYIVILNSRSVMENVREEAHVDYTVGELKKMISAAAVNDTEIFSVTVTSTDPKEAQQIADAIAKVLPKKIGEVVDGSSVRIVDEAQLPTGKSAPSIKKYTAYGAIMGVAIACLFIIIRLLTDTRIHDEDYLTETYHLPVLAVIPNLKSGDKGAYSMGYTSQQEKKGDRK